MRLRLALATFVCFVLGASTVDAQYPIPLPTPVPPASEPSEPSEPAGEVGEAGPEEEDESEEPIDVKELKPAKPRVRPKIKEKRPPKEKKPKGDAICEHRMPVYEHEVVEGDIVSSIAGRYGVKVGAIKKWNPKLDLNKISIGKKIKVCPEIAPRLREEFTYVVKKGDSLSEVGEKYGLVARQIVRMQAGSLKRRLEKDMGDLRLGDELTLVVDRGVLPAYAPKNEDRGTLKVGVSLEPGKAYYIKRPHLAYGTATTVKAIKAALSRYKQSKAGKGGPQVHVGDISARGGGPLKGHKSHQKGIDVDIGLVLKGGEANETRFRTGRVDNLDLARTWALIKAFVDNDDVRAVFLDYGLQKLLYEHAKKLKVSEGTLEALFQYPRGKGRAYGIIRHWKGHKDHFHVRFRK